MLKSRMDAMHDLPIFAAARASDPPTSHKAAARSRTFRGDHARRIGISEGSVHRVKVNEKRRAK